jgi:peroxiredoxin Q/BCP
MILPVLFAGLTLSAPAKTVAAGDTAPDFSAQNQDGKRWKLADHVGKKYVILYFYPKDDTKGCTKEACGLRDNMDTINTHDVEVVGVSFDSAESHKAFIAKYKLNFNLLVDSDGKLADSFGVRMPEKNMARRASFLIGKDGKIIHVTDSPSADTHLMEMRGEVEKLPKK